jgi:hypothetical protein
MGLTELVTGSIISKANSENTQIIATFFIGQRLLGKRISRSRAKVGKIGKTFRDRNGKLYGRADPVAAKPKNYPGLYGDHPRRDSQPLRTANLFVIIARSSERAV